MGHRTKAMFHSTAMVKDYDRTLDRLAQLFGMRVLEYGEAPEIGRAGGMTWIGDNSLELCQPIVEGAAPDRFVARTGGGMQGVAVWVDDFADTVAHLDALGVPMPVQMPRGFGFSSPRATCGLQLEWSEFTVPEDPRAGAPVPPLDQTPLVDVAHHAFVGAVVDEPIAAATALAAMLGTEVLFTAPEAGAGEAQAAVAVGDCSLALFHLEPDTSEALWGHHHDRPRVSLLGLAVSDLDATRATLTVAGVRILRERPGMLVLHPDDTGDIEIAVVDSLLPRDPRSP